MRERKQEKSSHKLVNTDGKTIFKVAKRTAKSRHDTSSAYCVK